ncbi:hypothetical protein CRG98_049694, partial [Punica granatum]
MASGKRKCLRRMLFSFRSPRRPVESFCFGDANGGFAFKGLDVRPPGFPSVLMCSETTVISVCQKRVLKACREAFVTIETSLGRS